MVKFSLVITLLTFSAPSLAQQELADTSWLNKIWRPCDADTASYYQTSTWMQGNWRQQMYYVPCQQLFMEGSSTAKNGTGRTGTFIWYYINGVKSDSIYYKDGKPRCIAHFHKNGQMKTLLLYNENKQATFVNSWNPTGATSYLDTFYHDRAGNECHKDTAARRGIIKLEDSTWHLRFYQVNTDSLLINSFYKERLCKTRVNFFTRYRHGILLDSIRYNEEGKRTDSWTFDLKGKIDRIAHYQSGKISHELYFHLNGNKNYYRSFDSTGKVVIAQNWDESGKESFLDSSMNYARPAKDVKTWKATLIKAINKDPSLDWESRGQYSGKTRISFMIDEEGTVTDVRIRKSSGIPAMDSLVLRNCQGKATWIPGTFHGRRDRFSMYYDFNFISGKAVQNPPKRNADLQAEQQVPIF